MKKQKLFIFGYCAMATLLHASSPISSLQGTWKSDCLAIDTNISVDERLLCSSESCDHLISLYETSDCSGNSMDLGPTTMAYKLEGNVDNLYDIFLSGPDATICYARIKIEADTIYLAKPSEDCSTPDRRLTEIDESKAFKKIQ